MTARMQAQVSQREWVMALLFSLVAKLVGQANAGRPPRKFGTLKCTVLYITPDFNALREEFKETME